MAYKNYQSKQMTSTARVMEGTLFATNQNGYTNQGTVTIALPSKINYLPVYSRCNQLLKWQESEKDKPKHKITQVFCSPLSNSKTSSLTVPKEHVKNSLCLLKKYVKIEDQEDQLTKTRHKPSSPPQLQNYLNDQNQTRTQNNRYDNDNDDLPSFMTNTKVLGRQNQLMKELEKQKLQRLSLEKEYNNLLKQAIQKRQKNLNHQTNKSDQNLMESDKSKSKNSECKFSKISFVESHHHKAKQQSIDSDEESQEYDDDLTVHPRLYSIARNKRVDDQVITYRKHQTGFPQDIYHELANIYDKISQLDANISHREEKLRRELLQRQIETQEKEIQRLRAKENHKKTYMVDGRKEKKQNQFVLLNYFILFVLGLLFTKAFLC